MGLKFSVEKIKVMFFTTFFNLKLYGSYLERVNKLGFLGVHFDPRLTWVELMSTVNNC